MAIKRGLGRGLAALIPTTGSSDSVVVDPRSRPGNDAPPPLPEMERPASSEIAIDLIRRNPYQPRTSIDDAELNELAQSISAQGLLQPVLVRPHGGTYQLVAGERRWHAAKRAGLARIPVIIRDCTDREMLELAIVENLQRADINALDSARAYRRLSDEFALTQGEVAERVGKSRSSIANTMRLLDLPPDVQQLLGDGKLSEGHARAILMCENAQTMRVLARKVVAQSLSVRKTEKLAQSAPRKRRKATSTANEAILADVVDRLRRRLGTPLRIQHKAQGGGTIEIDFFDDEQLTRVVDLLLGPSSEGGGEDDFRRMSQSGSAGASPSRS